MGSLKLLISNSGILLRIVLALVALTLYDTLWDLFLTLLHYLLMLLHYLFEFCEHALDLFIEQLFHTEPRTTEIIVFYLMAFAIGGIALKLMLDLPCWYCKLAGLIVDYYHDRKTKALRQWQNQPILEKVKWGLLVISSALLMVFWVAS